MDNPTTTPIVFIDLPEVERRTGIRKTRIYELIREGRFPKSVRVSLRASRWCAAEVEAWQRARLAERDAA